MRHDAASCDDAELTRHPSAMAACGWDLTVSVTEDGELHAWGHCVEGELGLGAVRRQNQPARAGGPEPFDNQRIRLAGLVHAPLWRRLESCTPAAMAVTGRWASATVRLVGG
jgi:hypothetical protein